MMMHAVLDMRSSGSSHLLDLASSHTLSTGWIVLCGSPEFNSSAKSKNNLPILTA